MINKIGPVQRSDSRPKLQHKVGDKVEYRHADKSIKTATVHKVEGSIVTVKHEDGSTHTDHKVGFHRPGSMKRD